MSKFKGNIFEKTAVKSTVKKPKAAEKKERMTYWLSPDLIDKVQAYAYWTPGETISATVETALQQYFKGKRIKSLPKDLQAERDAAKLKKMRCRICWESVFIIWMKWLLISR